MTKRISPFAIGNKTIHAIHALGKAVYGSSLDRTLIELVNLRVSQINGCAYCLDMHAKNLRAKGVPEEKLYLLNACQEAPCYTASEQAALAWAEAITRYETHLLPADVYEAAIAHFSANELVDLTVSAITINSYNRINFAFGNDAVGTYQVGSN